MLLAENECRPAMRRAIRLPCVRPSILDVYLEAEPWLHFHPCSNVAVLCILNHPIAVIPATPLETASMQSLLFQIRHRSPRLV